MAPILKSVMEVQSIVYSKGGRPDLAGQVNHLSKFKISIILPLDNLTPPPTHQKTFLLFSETALIYQIVKSVNDKKKNNA